MIHQFDSTRSRLRALTAVLVAMAVSGGGARAATFTVTNTADTGAGSLRQAITDANGTPGSTIRFNIPSSDGGYDGNEWTIAPASALPDITAMGTIINGYSQPGSSRNTLEVGFNASIKIVLDGTSAGALATGINILRSSCTVTGLHIRKFQSGIVLDGGSGGTDSFVHGNYIESNSLQGVVISGPSLGPIDGNNTIGGTSVGARNVISGNGTGVAISVNNHNVVAGNYIGTDSTGLAPLPNKTGIEISASATSNTIGGLTASARNVISGNSSGYLDTGVDISSNGGSPTSDNTLLGNYIGTDATGTIAMANDVGVRIHGDAQSNTIGGTEPGARNIISGNSTGIYVDRTSNNTVIGNYIGTDATGTVAVPNSTGIHNGTDAHDNHYGGGAAGEGNLISGNSYAPFDMQGGGTTGNIIAGNYIGTDATGTVAIDNQFNNGILVWEGSDNTQIGGPTPGERNIIGGTFAGITIYGCDGVTVAGNYVGCDMTGTAAIPNYYGIVIEDYFGTEATSHVIGGTGPGAGNLVSGNSVGIAISGNCSSNVVAGNLVGTDSTGTQPLGNNYIGILVSEGATNNTIGDTATGGRNIIACNYYGIKISDAGTTGNTVVGNHIGTDALGRTALGNSYGIEVDVGASGNIIGSTNAGGRNLISGNYEGIEFNGTGTVGNIVQGNYIGTDATGGAALANVVGIVLSGASGNTIGSTTADGRNLISGNTVAGVQFGGAGTSGNVVQGNYIGSDSTGTTPLPNNIGVQIASGSQNNTIGGTASGVRNVISGNLADGVAITGTDAAGNVVAGNYIGTNAGGGTPIPNERHGVYVEGASHNIIGGTDIGSANLIAYNGEHGIRLEFQNTIGNSIRLNRIYRNQGLGISLNGDGSRPQFNDADDSDTGANNLQNYPVFTGVSSRTANGVNVVDITGVLNSTPSTTFAIDLFRDDLRTSPGFGQGRYIVGTTDCTTDANGHGTFSFTTAPSPPAIYFSATATNLTTGDTSEFSPAGTTQPPIVTNTNDAGAGSLREAIYQANAVLGSTISFNIPTSDTGFSDGVWTIQLASSLPEIFADGTVIDGYTQPGASPNTLSVGDNATLKIVLDGSTYESGDGLIMTCKNGGVAGLIINHFAYAGINLQGTAEHNVVGGNFIGTNARGDAAFGNDRGIRLGSTGNTIGGTSPSARNVISGNTGDGIDVADYNNVIIGNYIGTNAAGTSALGNDVGVDLYFVDGTIIGDTIAGAGNLISGNNLGIWLDSDTTGNTVAGNLIGTDATGTAAIANDIGVYCTTGFDIIGGTAAGARNIISGNRIGVDLNDSEGATVCGNYIGTDVTGTTALGNLNGVVIRNDALAHTIGGNTAGARNIISGNTADGVVLNDFAEENTISGNYIGVNAAGSAVLPNGGNGVSVRYAALDNTIGGLTTGERNIISGNAGAGIALADSDTTGNIVAGNYIGADPSSLKPMPNAVGVTIAGGASGNTIGGTVAAARNIIAFNTGDGVQVTGDGTVGNTIRRVMMQSNGGLGINLGTDRVTPNDIKDPDGGPNGGQNSPRVTGVTITPESTTINVSINSLPNTRFAVEVYRSDVADPSGSGEGRVYVATVFLITDDSGNATGSFTMATNQTGQIFSATATNTVTGDTSEFSRALRANSSVVVNTQDSGIGSLRNAIDFANANPGAIIVFDIPVTDPNFAGGIFTIKPTSPLPFITAEGTSIDATTQDNGIIVLDGSDPGAGPDGLVVSSFNSFIRGITVQNFAHSGLTLNGQVDISNNTFGQTAVNNTGVATWNQPGDLIANGGAVFNNQGSGVFETIQNTNNVFQFSGTGTTPVFNNAGTFFKDGFATTTFKGVDFNNSGTVTTAGGTLRFTDGTFTQTAGTLRLDNGFITNNRPLAITGGVLTGSGTIAGSVVNNGELLLDPFVEEPGAAQPRTTRLQPRDTPGPLITVNGDLRQQASSTVTIGIAGYYNASNQRLFGSIGVGHAIYLDNCTLNINFRGYTPQPGEVYDIIRSTQPITGTFKTVIKPTGVNLSVVQSATSVFLVTGPVLSDFTPKEGLAKDAATTGTTVTLTGLNFTNPANFAPTVKFNGVAATVTRYSPTEIETVVPEGAATGKITVFTPYGNVTSATDFTVIPVPKITGLSPDNGPPGTVVTITGTTFTGATAVTFGGVSVGNGGFAVDATGTHIVTHVPSGAITGPVAVTAGGYTRSSANNFTVLPSAVFAFEAGTYTAAEGSGSKALTVVRSGGLSEDLNVAFQLVSSTATINSDYAMPAGAFTLNFKPNVARMDIVLAIKEDTALEQDETVTLKLVVAPSSTARLGTPSTTTLTITDNDVLPAITGFGVAQARPGTPITITGSGFTGATAVRFGGGAAAQSFTVDSSTQITATVPAGAVTGPVTVVTPVGSVTSELIFTVIVPPPTVTGLDLTSGQPGTRVTVTGTNFVGVTHVTIGTVEASFTVLSPTSLRMVAPTTIVSGVVSVTNGSGTGAGTQVFTVTPPPVQAPKITNLRGVEGKAGDVITIEGTNFNNASLVRFNNKNTTFTVVSSVYIRAVVPVGMTNGPVIVTTPGGTAQSPMDFTILLPPTIATFEPVHGPVGTKVTIKGTNLARTSFITFNNANNTNFTVVSDNEVWALVPATMVTGPISVTTSVGKVTSGGLFLVEAPPNIVKFDPASGAVGDLITITGSNFTGLRELKFFNDKAPTIVSITDTEIKARVPAGASTGPMFIRTAIGSMTTRGPFIVVPGTAPRASTVMLSSASANAAKQSVSLVFSGALDAASTADTAHYGVTVNGKPAIVEGVAYDAAARRLTVYLADGSFAAGDSLNLTWTGLLDAAANPLPPGVFTLPAR